jgi:hypothetical protein
MNQVRARTLHADNRRLTIDVENRLTTLCDGEYGATDPAKREMPRVPLVVDYPQVLAGTSSMRPWRRTARCCRRLVVFDISEPRQE